MIDQLFSVYENTKDIRVVKSGGITNVVVKGKPYMSWESSDDASQRLAIVQLYRYLSYSQEELAKIFGVHVNSIQNYISCFAKEGLDGLVTHRSGPRQKWKLTPVMRAKILNIYLKEGIIEYESIQKRLKTYNESVSIMSIRQVLLENGFIKEDIKVTDSHTPQLDLFPIQSENQLQLTFEYEIKAKEESGSILFEQEYDDELKSNDDRCKKVELIGKRKYSVGQRIYLNQLEQRDYSAYAGGFLFAALLKRYTFLPLIKSVIKIPTYEGYSIEELCLTLFYFDLFGFRSMEEFKTVYPEEFGMLIGRSKSPSHYTLRRFLHKVRKLNKSEELIDTFASMYIQMGIANSEALYIDGHFLPYYGMYLIKKGWHGVRHIPMKGSYNFICVDEKFNPWLFLIRSSAEDLLQKIPELIEKVKKIRNDSGIKKEEKKELIVIFDREGYSAELFRWFDGRDIKDKDRRAIFISWAKYSDKWVYKIPEESFEKTVTVTYDIQKPKVIKYFETERPMNKYGDVRTIVIEREKDKKRAAIYTNGTANEIESETIVKLICRRWGEENLIKELLYKHLINYSPGYVLEELLEQPMVDNPKIIELKKKNAVHVRALNKLKLQLGENILKKTKNKVKLEEIENDQKSLLVEIALLETKILFKKQEIEKLPAKIRFDEAYDSKRLQNFNYEKKRFLDCIKVFTYNIEKKMSELISNYYDVKKEIFPALSMIIKRGGYVKLSNGRLNIQLRRFMNREIDYAARRLCEDLNSMNPVTLDRFGIPIHYEVA